METPPDHEAPSFATKLSTHHRPDAKQQRYDRQLRLWAASGQAALESAHVLVVNGGAASTSTLKNLVLPGVGQFTILDDKKVDEHDLGNNFFLQPGSSRVGDSRAEQAAKYLVELNDGVRANSLVKNVRQFLNEYSDSLGPYSLVISVNAPPEDTLLLSDACWTAGVPLIAVKTCGFLASIKTQMQEAHCGFLHYCRKAATLPGSTPYSFNSLSPMCDAVTLTVVETHPEQEATLDLRLDRPFPELDAHASAIDFDSLDSHEYAHIPPIVILLQALQKWRADHDGNNPRDFKEKKAFRDSLDTMKRGGKNADHENFDEAKNLVMKSVKETRVPEYIESLFKSESCEKITKSSPPFWLLLRAVRNFVESPSTNGGARLLPLSGSLPDMKATSAGYGKLVAIYREKSRNDVAAVRKELDFLLAEAGKGSVRAGTFVNEEMLTVFIKNVAFVKVVRGRRMRDEYERPDTPAIQTRLSEASQPNPFADPDAPAPIVNSVKPIHYYLALRAADTFYVENSRWPGDPQSDAEPGEDDGEDDMDGMKDSLGKVATVCLGEGAEWKDLAKTEALELALSEVSRAGSADLPQIAALTGGIVAQEAIKILTKQYVPLNGTVIFDGIRSVSETFNF